MISSPTLILFFLAVSALMTTARSSSAASQRPSTTSGRCIVVAGGTPVSCAPSPAESCSLSSCAQNRGIPAVPGLGRSHAGRVPGDAFDLVRGLLAREADFYVVAPPGHVVVQRDLDRSDEAHDDQEHGAGHRQDEHGERQPALAPEQVPNAGRVSRGQQPSADPFDRPVQRVRAEVSSDAVRRDRLPYADGRTLQRGPQRGQQRRGHRRKDQDDDRVGRDAERLIVDIEQAQVGLRHEITRRPHRWGAR